MHVGVLEPGQCEGEAAAARRGPPAPGLLGALQQATPPKVTGLLRRGSPPWHAEEGGAPDFHFLLCPALSIPRSCPAGVVVALEAEVASQMPSSSASASSAASSSPSPRALPPQHRRRPLAIRRFHPHARARVATGQPGTARMHSSNLGRHGPIPQTNPGRWRTSKPLSLSLLRLLLAGAIRRAPPFCQQHRWPPIRSPPATSFFFFFSPPSSAAAVRPGPVISPPKTDVDKASPEGGKNPSDGLAKLWQGIFPFSNRTWIIQPHHHPFHHGAWRQAGRPIVNHQAKPRPSPIPEQGYPLAMGVLRPLTHLDLHLEPRLATSGPVLFQLAWLRPALASHLDFLGSARNPPGTSIDYGSVRRLSFLESHCRVAPTAQDDPTPRSGYVAESSNFRLLHAVRSVPFASRPRPDQLWAGDQRLTGAGRLGEPSLLATLLSSGGGRELSGAREAVPGARGPDSPGQGP
ncbi:hypothetical protein CDD83_2486 [Cordyceps sp. RAO-2017]|nr:hypothetical protein CDD83_2486 [Cordyceps sp. RAO-2017]